MYNVITQREVVVHIGQYVEKVGSKGTYGIITDRPMVHECWTVRWIIGPNRGRTLISHQRELRLHDKL